MKAQPKKQADIIKAIEAFAADPTGSHPNAKALKGGGFRLRVRDWRVSLTIDHKSQAIDVYEIEVRGQAYR